ncbi:hypothetical protein [Massilia aquatica]|uniref:HEAT repeat domain-containing protein n=1 Tax=Massilia aquatica TaxID=2609000 RepID=A0ABX0MCU8_9BURK|nr:hypothetical protein [Massilia aquatica]NHZ42077.1 hypothetical protein [Massilia aquatica]
MFAPAAQASKIAYELECPSQLADLTPERVETMMQQEPRPDLECYMRALVRSQGQAVPVLVRLLRDQRDVSRTVALWTMVHLGPAAAPALPELMALHQREMGELDRLQAQGADYKTLAQAQSAATTVTRVFRDLGRVAQPAIPYLSALYANPAYPHGLRDEIAMAIWQISEENDSARLRTIAALLSSGKVTHEAAQLIAPFLIRMGSRASPVLPALRTSLLNDWTSGLIDAYLAVQGDEIGIPYLFQVGGESPTPVADTLRKRGPLADRYVTDAIKLPSSRTAAIALLRDIDLPGAMAHLVDELDNPASADSAATAFVTIGRKSAPANQKLLALLDAGGTRDRARRNLLLNAIDSTGPVTGIARSLLLDAFQDDLRVALRQKDLEQRQRPCKGQLCAPVDCLSARLLEKSGALVASDLPMLKRAYRDAAQAGARACLSNTTGLIASLGSRPALEFLYERFLASRREHDMDDLRRGLTINIAPAVPRIAAGIGRLRGDRLVMVESMLLAPGGEEFLATYQARVVPGLLALPFAADADRALAQSYSEYSRSIGMSPGMPESTMPTTRGGLAVLRIERIAPRTPELMSVLLRMAAGSGEDVAKQAEAALGNIRIQQRALRAACFREIGDWLVALPAGPAQRRLARLQKVYAFSYKDHGIAPLE